MKVGLQVTAFPRRFRLKPQSPSIFFSIGLHEFQLLHFKVYTSCLRFLNDTHALLCRLVLVSFGFYIQGTYSKC